MKCHVVIEVAADHEYPKHIQSELTVDWIELKKWRLLKSKLIFPDRPSLNMETSGHSRWGS